MLVKPTRTRFLTGGGVVSELVLFSSARRPTLRQLTKLATDAACSDHKDGCGADKLKDLWAEERLGVRKTAHADDV